MVPAAGHTGTPPQLISIVSTPRAGSSLLGRILAEASGVAYPGEIDLLWERTFAGSEICGCGATPGDCEVWSSLPAAICDAAGWTEGQFLERSREHARLRLTFGPSAFLRNVGGATKELGNFIDDTRVVIETIAREHAASALVDTSKSWLMYAALPHLHPDTTTVVFLRRDPLGVYVSLKKRAPETPSWRTAGDAARIWWTSGLTARRLGRAGMPIHRLTHLELASEPEAAVSQILDQAGIEGRPAFITERVVALGEAHVATGNLGVRRLVGPTPLRRRPDVPPRDDRVGPLLVSALTLGGRSDRR